MGKRRISRRQFLEGSGTALTVAAAAPALRAQRPAPPPAPRTSIALTVNGTERRLEVEDRWTLVEAIRDHIGLTGTKIGCDRGECGACTVLLDGRPISSCLLLAPMAEDHDIATIEGLQGPAGELHPIQQSFVDHTAFQCSYCTPGFILTTKTLLEEQPDASRDDAREYLAGNLCRCGSYVKILDAVMDAKARLAEGAEGAT